MAKTEITPKCAICRHIKYETEIMKSKFNPPTIVIKKTLCKVTGKKTHNSSNCGSFKKQ